jgi:hypothetical protein
VSIKVLISYAYRNAIDWPLIQSLVAAGRIKVILDCGAFTVWHAHRKPIALDDYCAWVREHEGLFWRYFTLDVIHEPQPTMANYLAMLDRGMRPIPIFTHGSPPRVLDDYLAHDADLVAFSGPKGAGAMPAYFARVCAHMRARGRREHLLGFSNPRQMQLLHPYSTDSSTWSGTDRYGRLHYWNDSRMMTMSFDFLHLVKGKQRVGFPADFLRFVRNYGFDVAQLSRHGHYMRFITGATWLILQQYMERLGTMLWLVCTATRNLNVLLEARAHLERSAPHVFSD